MKVLNLSCQAAEEPSVLQRAASQPRPKPLPKIASLLFELEDGPPGGSQGDLTESPAITSLRNVLDFHSELEALVLEQWPLVVPAADVAAQLADLARRLQPCCTATVQSSLGGGGGSSSLRNLRHTWLSCVGGNGERFLFDPVWREQWQVLNPSEGYARLLASLPEAFCGSEQRLVAAVQLLCRELEAEFAGKGCSLPPWRSLQATLSKWRAAGPQQQASSRPQPAPYAPAAQLLHAAPPRRVSSGFPPGGCTATLSAAPHTRSGKPEAGPEGRTLYSRMADGFQRANRTYGATMLSNGL